VATTDVLSRPGIVQIRLPAAAELKLWDNLDPLDEGTGEFPPSLEDTRLKDRLITWLRVRGASTARFRLLWAGINATTITQRAEVFNEVLPSGTGAPDQKVALAKTPVIPRSIRLTVAGEKWDEIEDLMAAGAEVPAPDPRLQPGAPQPKNERIKVFRVNAESGEIFFGDGIHGARPPFNASIRADYGHGAGSAGNVNAGAINNSPALPAGLKVTNPVGAWGGADSETVSDGEKQITRYLQHRDRLVTAADFKTIARRTPGVDIGRIEVIPVWSPELNDSEPGDAPGAVTLMLIPRYDPEHPNAPEPNREFLNAVCDYLDERRLVTTEVFLCGPRYRDLWLSVGIVVDAGRSIAEVTQAAKDDLLKFLSPLPQSPAALCDGAESDPAVEKQCGWPLRKPVIALELMARASRTDGVTLVSGLLLAEGDAAATATPIELRGLDLPRVAGISVTVGDPLPLDQLRGAAQPVGAGQLTLPVPVIPDECR
jgi:predicted phage baseplate assembly protein